MYRHGSLFIFFLDLFFFAEYIFKIYTETGLQLRVGGRKELMQVSAGDSSEKKTDLLVEFCQRRKGIQYRIVIN